MKKFGHLVKTYRMTHQVRFSGLVDCFVIFPDDSSGIPNWNWSECLILKINKPIENSWKNQCLPGSEFLWKYRYLLPYSTYFSPFPYDFSRENSKNFSSDNETITMYNSSKETQSHLFDKCSLNEIISILKMMTTIISF